MDESTIPRVVSTPPIRALRVVVTAGPALGASFAGEADRISIGQAEGNDLVLADPTVSRFHAEIRRAGNRIELADLGSTNGTRVGSVVVRSAAVEIDAGAAVALGDTQLRVENGEWIFEDDLPETLQGLVGRAPAMRRLAAMLVKIAPSAVPVCIGGESGTGKEVVARALHELGPRATGPFVTVDCAAISPGLFASELFGHERGAFTGADRKHSGAFERAHGGTIFLDEVGELPAELQAALLGALERRRIRRVGGREDVPVDVRVLCATHRDLRAEVNAGRFRLDLYYRLAAVHVVVPPLRDRAGDIPVLVSHFLAEAGDERGIDQVFSRAELDAMGSHAWPGNVRELRNVVQGALALGHSPLVSDPAGSASEAPEAFLAWPYKQARREVIDGFERRYLRALIDRTGSVRAAAREAQIDRMYLTELLRKHGIV